MNPPPIKVSLELILLLVNKGLDELTSKSKMKDLLSSRLAVREIIASSDTFLKDISTIGPPGLIGCNGPETDTTSIGCTFSGVCVGIEPVVDVHPARGIKSINANPSINGDKALLFMPASSG
jgi:hypothetical protein